jgi:hypothetical protein
MPVDRRDFLALTPAAVSMAATALSTAVASGSAAAQEPEKIPSPSAPPRLILLMRHAEKLGSDDNEDSGGPNLSIRGSARAMALPTLFAPPDRQPSCTLRAGWQAARVSARYEATWMSGDAQLLPMPNAVFAARESHNSKRSIETVAPFAACFGLKVNTRFRDHQTAELAAELLTSGRYANQVVLVCWHHGRLPKLASDLGVPEPPRWMSHVFDRLWQVTFPNGQLKFTDTPQRLLFGDSST